jgi:hypothetical protein
MTPPKILICNYTPAEEKAWRFLLRGFPMLQVISVPPQQFGCTLAELAEGQPKSGSVEPSGFTGRMAIFAGAQGELLKKHIDLSGQVTKEHAFRAILTDSNRNWTLNRLYAQLEKEEQSLMGKRK